jgi:site-specific recombinase XerD
MNPLLQRYERDLSLRGFSPRTFKVYVACIKQFQSYFDNSLELIDSEIIKDYLYYLLTVKKASDSKVRQVYSAMKYLYTQTLSRSWDEMKIPQLKKRKNYQAVSP